MQVGAGPPFQNPPSVRDLGSACGASLRASRRELAISGRGTQTPGRSPCFRPRIGGPSPLAGEVGWGGSGFLSRVRGAARHGSLRARRKVGDDRPIGVFDSGVGGLTVLRAIRDRLPLERTVYVADLLHFPYGPRYQEEVKGFAFDIIRHLASRDVQLIVIACN